MRDFIQAILTPATGYGELRAIKDHRVWQQFYPLAHPTVYDDISDEATRLDRLGWDVYYGVLRRNVKDGKAESVVDHAPVLWADVDTYKYSHEDYDGALHGLSMVLNFPVPASIIVDSGHGLHAYWLLRDAMPTADASLAMKGIAKDIGGDHTHDSARVLRLPGLTNHKDPKNPVPVRLLRLDTTRRYASSDFAEYIDKGSPEKNGTPSRWNTELYRKMRQVGYTNEETDRTADGIVRRLDLPPWLDELIVNGVEKGQRSETCFKVMLWLIRYGWNGPEIISTFRSNPTGIGEKMAGMNVNAASRWFIRTHDAALAAA